MSDAPGLQKRKRAGGKFAYYWSAMHVTRAARDYPLKTIRIIGDDEAHARQRCRVLTQELREWLAEQAAGPEYDGTVASLIDCYQRDEESPYRINIKENTRRDYDGSLAILRKAVGDARIEDLTGKDFSRWYRGFKKPAEAGGPERIRRAHGCMKLMRTVANYGASMRYAGCADVAVILGKMRFEMPAARESSMSFEQASAIVDKSLATGKRSIALAQALQFETTLRQKDVIGEWRREPDGPGIEDRGAVWENGILWSDLSPGMILRKKTTKKGKVSEWNLALCPLVMKALEAFPLELARVRADSERAMPMIVAESTGLPYRQHRFGVTWREIADAAGVPRGVWNMDSRAGGLTEADEAGADPHDIQRHATHSDLKTTGRYVRRNRQANERVAVLRVASRSAGENDT